MHIRRIIASLLVCISLSAAAEFTTIELVYEIALSNLKVPAASTGSLMFKECDDCETLMVRMTRDTQFLVNGENVGLKEFRKNVFQVRDRKAETILVRRHLESDTIMSISADL